MAIEQELLVLFWKCLEEIPAFMPYVLRQCDVRILCVQKNLNMYACASMYIYNHLCVYDIYNRLYVCIYINVYIKICFIGHRIARTPMLFASRRTQGPFKDR
jgi:hypothetical protein